MSKRMVNDEFWTDTYVEDLDPSEKLLFLYLITNPLCNVAGIYEIKLKRIAYETGFDKEMVEKILSRFERDGKVLRQDDWIIVVNFAKNQANNPNMLQGMQRIIDALPEKIKTLKGFKSLPHFTLLNLLLPEIDKHKKFISKSGKELPVTTGDSYIPDHNPPKKKKIRLSGDQWDYIIRSQLIPVFKKAVNQVHGKDYFKEEDEETDFTNENSRLCGQIKQFWNKCGGDFKKAKEIIEWFASDYGKFCNWKPSVCFRKETVIDWRNRETKKGKTLRELMQNK